MLRLALKNVRHNPRRLILTAIAVSLGVALVSATHVFTNALSSGFGDLYKDIYGSVDVIVEPDPDSDIEIPAGTSPFTDDDLATVRGVEGVAAADGSLSYQMGALLDKDGQAPNGGQGGPPSILINWTGNEDLDGATLVDGAAPTAPGEAVIDVDSFANRDLNLGDTVGYASQVGVTQLKITGTVRFGENNDTQTATLIWAPIETVREIAEVPGYDGIQVIVGEGANPEDVAASIQKVLPDGTRAITAEQKIQEQTDSLDQALSYVNIFTLAFALIALFVGAYIIVNTFRIIVTQRTRELGLLRAIGMKGSQVRAMILLEALVVGLVASTLGILAGWALALGLTALLELAVGDIFGAITIPPDAIAWGYILGTLVTLVAALMPAIHAARIAPMEALRESGTASRKPLRVRNVVGGALALVGAILFFVGLFASLAKPYIYVGFGAVLLILGVTLLAAQVLVPLAYGLRGLLSSMFGIDGKLAANNIRREPRRSANTAAALMIGVTLLALAATFTESVKATILDAFTSSEADIYALATAAPIPQGAVDIIAGTEGVAWAGREGMGEVTYDGTQESLWIMDADVLGGVYHDQAGDRDLSELGDGVWATKGFMGENLAVGDEIELKGAASTQNLEITGEAADAIGTPLLTNWNTGEKLLGEVDINQVSIAVADGFETADVEKAITEALAKDYPLVQLQSVDQIAQFAQGFVDFFLNVITVMLGAALVIAILGVANTLLLSVTERTREIGLLRAVGLKRSSIWRMVTLESVVMALFGTVLGMILGVGIGSALVISLKDLGITGFAIPWLNLAIYTVVAFLAGIVAALWPALRAARLDILQAIAADG